MDLMNLIKILISDKFILKGYKKGNKNLVNATIISKGSFIKLNWVIDFLCIFPFLHTFEQFLMHINPLVIFFQRKIKLFYGKSIEKEKQKVRYQKQ